MIRGGALQRGGGCCNRPAKNPSMGHTDPAATGGHFPGKRAWQCSDRCFGGHAQLCAQQRRGCRPEPTHGPSRMRPPRHPRGRAAMGCATAQQQSRPRWRHRGSPPSPHVSSALLHTHLLDLHLPPPLAAPCPPFAALLSLQRWLIP